jgi:MFS family permease
MLYLFAAVYGIAHGSYFTVMSPLVAELFGLASHGAILGIGFLFGNLGGSIGPVLAGLVFDTVRSYRPVFLTMIGLAVGTLILANILRPAVHKELRGS